MVDHDVDDVRAGVEVIPPSILRDQRAAHHAAAVPHQVLEHRVFLRGQLDQLAPAADLARTLVELEVANVQLVRRERLRPTRERLDPREELFEGEGFRDVIIRTGAQRRDLRIDGVLRRQHEHRLLESLRAKTVEHLETGLLWKPHVEDNEIVRLRAGPALPFVSISDKIDGVALLFEPAPYILSYGGIVLDDENPHAPGASDKWREN